MGSPQLWPRHALRHQLPLCDTSGTTRVVAARIASQAIPISGDFVGSADDPIGMRVDVSVSAVLIR